jgi:AhpD family alkylhydroperoxidase
VSNRFDYNQVAPVRIKALSGVYGYVMQSSLPYRAGQPSVSRINNCAYCLDKHRRDLLRKGQNIEQIAPVQASAEAGNLFDAREWAALAWAETVIRVAETGVPDEAYLPRVPCSKNGNSWISRSRWE